MDRAYDRTAERLIEMLKQQNSRHINDDELHSHLNDRLSSSGDANSTNVNVNNGTVFSVIVHSRYSTYILKPKIMLKTNLLELTCAAVKRLN